MGTTDKSSGHNYAYIPTLAITIAEAVKLLMSIVSYLKENDEPDFRSNGDSSADVVPCSIIKVALGSYSHPMLRTRSHAVE